ncbi:hypothetical protein BPLS_P5789 [Bathymodiolus platifrons methanotrophic gill symbiont]|uniref:hypothetical protein n=1 Tax=Bathymodiolus platifrons methanotrophic gill symbiont TaxID=113268 RepID=UPI000B40ED53|nr:hypothetical protein [Bathymodiolus platifrons methanotrophic gill symbiont]MCK5870785.1 hypothetical protein [Methyloprofundus sp.]TXK95177.1 hypothetical protein BMR10_11045 [Methylococcaceae bacterium CS4]TXK96252.1 hypothetical protein BMR11_12145 [Methylococcaceae bacterium CS5]TXK99594.1 hypothetical protein BMR02_07500 [Methylococcaceae bacterium HT1]TXL03964.1 hypothetical protein BMR09_13750 [Methylococcaceae bacterium CS3]TXL06153.1 hypothetical protein BMR07_07770 [Methylococcac
MLIILAAIITVVVFYQTGKKNGENGIRWALIGFFGYVLGYMISWVLIGETFISIFIGCVTVYFSRIQLLKMLARKKV